MTRYDTPTGIADLNASVAHLMQQFGRWTALREVIRQFFRHRSRPPDSIDILSDHHRKDVGLPPIPPAAERWMPPRF